MFSQTMYCSDSENLDTEFSDAFHNAQVNQTSKYTFQPSQQAFQQRLICIQPLFLVCLLVQISRIHQDSTTAQV